jgi:hypothetical protein
MVENYSTHLNEKTKSIIISWNFFNELKVLAFVLNPLCDAVLALERRTADLSDCYLGLARISFAIKRLPHNFNPSFRNYCIEKINERFLGFDDDNYLLAFFLNPLFRGLLFIFCHFIYLNNY